MKPRTLKENLRAENKARNILIPLGWKHKGNWRFEINNKEYDLSATNINWAINNLM